jgi:hypothetical protein
VVSSALAPPRLLNTKVINPARINNNTPAIAPTIVPIKPALSKLPLLPDAGVVVVLEIEEPVTLADDAIEA